MNVMLTTHAHLSSLSALAERRYPSLQKTIEATLQGTAEQLLVHSSFLLYLNRQQTTLDVSVAYHAGGESAILPGASVPCALSVAAGAPLFAPLVLEEMTTIPAAAPFLANPIFSDIGCYISVPIRLADGTVFGFLCGVDDEARQFANAQIEVMLVLARHLAAEIERDRDQGARSTAEAQLEQAQATLRATRGEMERMQKIKRDFVMIVSHEFRTALTGIQGFSEIVRDEECSMDEVKEYVADINADARRLNRLITDMLDLDRMETGKMKLAAGHVNLSALLNDIVTRFSPSAPRHTIQMQLESNLPAVPGDGKKLEQALTHILNNAVKFSPGGGVITVSTRRDDVSAHVSIQDCGIGIPADELERIFDRFARVEAGTSRYIQGTGLGLSIVHDTIQLHGGKVWAESVLSNGTTVHLTIPFTATN